MSLIVEFLGNMTKCLNSKKMLRSNCISSNSDDNNTNSASKVAIRNRLKMEKKLERLSNLTKKLLDDLEEQEDINNNNSIGESDEMYEYNFTTSHQQDTDNEENETTGIHKNGKLPTQRDFVIINSDSVCMKECVVCLACPARIETMPCRHTVLCKRCFLRTIQTVIAQGTATLKCVLCRTKIVAINELEPIARRSGVYNGEKHPTRSTDPIKPKFSKLQNQPVPCKSAVSLFRRSGRVQDSNGASSPTHTYHPDPNCQHPTQVRRKEDRIYHLLPSDCSNTFDDRT